MRVFYCVQKPGMMYNGLIAGLNEYAGTYDLLYKFAYRS